MEFNIYQNFDLILLTVASIAMLYYGADLLLSGSLDFAAKLKISEMLISVTLIAWITSLPEFLVLFEAINHPEGSTVAYSTILGSNFANLGLVLGLSILIKFKDKFDFNFSIFKNIVFISLLSTLIFLLYGLNILQDIVLKKILSIGMVLGIILYILISNKKTDNFLKKERSTKTKITLKIIAGGLLLGVGSNLLANLGLKLQNLGFSPSFVGSIYFALASSSPEIFTSLFAIFKYKKHDLVIGNVLGSNLANIFIFGILGLIFSIGNINLNPLIPGLLVVLEIGIFLIFYAYYISNNKKDTISINSLIGLLLFSVYYVFYRFI
ncbi:hypothetical protein CL651_000245 [bacterium]|nr:hypothetical protein [bacterium]|tara:strand:+ start:36881 stop:37852 length:972 start_codon:yes stop_codon:yes gene_type:complete